jgi:cation:H+ antiporter
VDVIVLIAGLAGLWLGTDLTIRAAIQVADALNIEQSLIAIIIIGLGTSLPELSISIGAALRKRSGLSVAILIGSNILDTLMPIGIAGAISRLDFDAKILRIDLPFLFALSTLVLIFFARESGLRQAAIVLVAYCGYAFMRISNA